MKLQPEQLSAKGFRQLDTLKHQELIPFVQEYMSKKNIFTRLYNWLNLLIFASLVALAITGYLREKVGFSDLVGYISYGILFAFLLIPIHEYIHALAYKYVGAKKVSYDANWKKFYFMAMADQFVVNRKEFQLVALAPFTVVSACCLVALLFTPLHWDYSVISLLLVHTMFCSGDFSLLSFFEFHKDKVIVTYDDKSEGISYFYEQQI